MAANAMIQARVDSKLKQEAAAVLAGVGLTVSDAVRLMLVRVVQDKTLPFNVWRPNAETRAAMLESEEILRVNKARFATAEALFDDLEESS
jgi:DNA-damage-inducible protein J